MSTETRIQSLVRVFVLLPLQAAGCGGADLTLAPADGGVDGSAEAADGSSCAQAACATDDVWDSLQCACVPGRDAACPPLHCLTGYTLDPLTCQCLAVTATSDSGVIDASEGECSGPDIPEGPCSTEGLTCRVGPRGSCTCTSGSWNCFLPP